MTKLTMKILDRLITASEKLRSNPKQGFEFLMAQRPLLQQQSIETDGPDGLANWAYFFKDLLAYSNHFPSRDMALEAAREAVVRFRIDKETLNHGALMSGRIVLRKSHAILAEHALGEERVADACAHISACFSVKSSSGEYEDPFAPFEVLRARILLASGREGDARGPFFDALLRAEKKARLDHRARLALEAAPSELRAWLEHPDFAAFKSGHAVEKLRRAHKGEKWPAAVKRVEAMIAVLWPDEVNEGQRVAESVTRYAAETAETLERLETQIGCAIPTPLRKLYLEHGAFTLRDPGWWRSLRLYHSGGHLQMVDGLQNAINNLWGGRPEFAASFDAHSIERLNREFFAFGHFLHDDNAYTHLYFTRNGGFGVLYYHQDDWGSAYDSLQEILANPDHHTVTLDEVISEYANAVVDALIEMRDEADSEA